MKRLIISLLIWHFGQITHAFAQNTLIEVTKNCRERDCQLVFQTAAEIFQIAGISSRIYLSPIRVDISVPGKGIYLSRPVLQRILNDSIVSGYAEFIIQFLVAHELAHQIQFKNYTQNMSNISSCEIRRLYECQADILAGGMISQLYRLDDSVALGSRFTPLMVHALDFVYKIGDDENSITAHPSAIQRRSAFRLGLAFPILMSKLYSNNSNISESIDYRNNEDSLTWSLRLARHIIHFPNAASKYIIYTNPSDEEFEQLTIWDTSKRNPFVVFKTGYFKNTGDKPIKIFLQSRLVGKEREYWEPSKPFLQGRVKNLEVKLMPGDSSYFNGKLNWWGLATANRMPALIIPPDNEALYDAQLESSEPLTYDQDCPTRDFASQNDSISNEVFAIDLLSADRYAASRRFDDLKVGFGTKSIKKYDDISYSTGLGSRNGFESEILENAGENPKLSLWASADSVSVASKFNIAVQSLGYLASFGRFKIRNDYHLHYHEEDNNSLDDDGEKKTIYHIQHGNILVVIAKGYTRKTMEGVFLDTKTKISVSQWRDENKGKFEYSVNIEIESANRDKPQ